MTRKKEAANTTATERDVALAVTAALLAPDEWHETVCTRLRARLAQTQVRHEEAGIAAILVAEAGTVIEPFVLTERDRQLAALLAALAFSSAYRLTRFRVVSRETIGNDGGLVLTDNLKAYYVERHAASPHPRNTFTGGLLAPAMAQAGRKDDTASSLGITPTRMEIRVPWHVARPLHDGLSPLVVGTLETLPYALQRHSSTGKGKSLSSIGLAVALENTDFSVEPITSAKHAISITAHTSEAKLRLMALCAQEETLVIRASEAEESADYTDIDRRQDGMGDQRLARITLALPDPDTDEPARLSTQAIYRSADPWNWVRLPRKNQDTFEPLLTTQERDALLTDLIAASPDLIC